MSKYIPKYTSPVPPEQLRNSIQIINSVKNPGEQLLHDLVKLLLRVLGRTERAFRRSKALKIKDISTKYTSDFCRKIQILCPKISTSMQYKLLIEM